MRIPSYADYISAENSAAAMLRGLPERNASWGTLIAIAQKVLTETQAHVRRLGQQFEPEELYSPDSSSPLIAASRIMDAASTSSDRTPQERRDLSLLAAASFAMYGNFPSAHVAACRAVSIDADVSPLLWFAAGCFSPKLLGDARQKVMGEATALKGVENLQAFLLSGDPNFFENALATTVEGMQAATSGVENILLGYARISLLQLWCLSTENTLGQSDLIDSRVIDKLLDCKIWTLLPTQYNAVINTKLLESEENALVSLPTSTGKTLIGELAVARALGGRPGLAVYIAPYVAIGLQVAESLRAHLPDDHRVSLYVGGLELGYTLEPTVRPEILVATPERLDALSRSTRFFDNLRIVVVDEAHLVASGVRGVRLEALITRMRLQQKLGRPFRIVALSAVMSEPTDFRRWLGVPDELHITDTWRPTVRRIAIWGKNNRLTWLFAGDELRAVSVKPTDPFGSRALTWPKRMNPASDFAGQKAQSPALYENIAFVCQQLNEEYNAPVLCVCMSRASSRGVAQHLISMTEEFSVVPPAVEKIIDRINLEAPHLHGLAKCLRHGVAYHNASLPISIRAMIEDCVRSRDIKVVAATTTLAEGVDLPFRITVVAEWLTWRLDTKDSQRPMDPMVFRNIAGRSGRAGVFTEGDTVIFENVLGPSRFVDDQFRRDALLSVLGRPGEIRSALEEDVLPAEVEARKRALSSNVLAAIPENPNAERLELLIAESLFARSSFNGGSIAELTAEIRSELTESPLGAFAVANSPLRLTPLGEAACRSLFSPASCRRIIDAMSQVNEGQTFEEICSSLLLELGDLPEQQNAEWHKAVVQTKSKFVVKRGDLQFLIQSLTEGSAPISIFSDLPSVKRSNSRDKLSLWLSGDIVSEHWSSTFDKFSDFIGSVIGEFLPWLLRACELLSPFALKSALVIPWNDYVARAERLTTVRQGSTSEVNATPDSSGTIIESI